MAGVALSPTCIIVSNHGAPIETCILRFDEPQPRRRTGRNCNASHKSSEGEKEKFGAVYMSALVVNKQNTDLHLAKKHAIAA